MYKVKINKQFRLLQNSYLVLVLIVILDLSCNSNSNVIV